MYGVKCHFWESIYVSPSPEFPWLYSLDIYKSLFHCFGSWRRVQKAGNKGRWNGNDQGGMERSGYILAFFCFQAFKIIYKKENLRLGLQKEEREPEGQEQTEPRAEVPKLEGVRCVVLCTQQWALPPLANCPWTSSLRGYLEGRLGCVCRCVCVCVWLGTWGWAQLSLLWGKSKDEGCRPSPRSHQSRLWWIWDHHSPLLWPPGALPLACSCCHTTSRATWAWQFVSTKSLISCLPLHY